MNQWLLDGCIRICNERKHSIFKDKTIQKVFETEQASLIPVKRTFAGYAGKECSVSSTSLIRYDRDHYGVPCKTTGRTVTVRAGSFRIIVIKDGEQIACHQRYFDREEQTIYDPWHLADCGRTIALEQEVQDAAP